MSTIPPEPKKEEILTLRSSAVQKLEELGAGATDPRDVTRIKQDDDYIRRFLMHHDNDQKLALDMIVETLQWRKDQAVNDITPNMLNQKIMDLANLFPHNRDTDGFKMLIFIVGKHFKGVNDIEDLKKILIYWLERLEREEYGKWITVFFDMRNTGMKNMDMEFIQYMINLFKSYYPWILNNIIVYEMPWLLNAMWKIIKTWLPPKSVEKIKFVDSKALTQYVAADQALSVWGGSDNYQFSFVPEQPRQQPWLRAAAPPAPVAELDAKKQVHFSDITVSGSSVGSVGGPSMQPPGQGALLQLTPSEELLFDCSRYGASATITITNPHQQPFFFKVKTTSPDKFRVRPSVGLLAGGGGTSQVSVNVLTVGDQPSLTPALLVREKFLVMSLMAGGGSTAAQDIAAAFRNAPKDSLSEVRLRVGVSSSSSLDASHSNGALPSQHSATEAQLLAKMEELLRGQRALQDHLNSSRRLVFVMLVLMVAVLLVLVITTNSSAQALLVASSNGVSVGGAGVMHAADVGHDRPHSTEF